MHIANSIYQLPKTEEKKKTKDDNKKDSKKSKNKYLTMMDNDIEKEILSYM